jgi:hypothetical protein
MLTYCGNTAGENNGENQACNLKFHKLSHPDLHLLTLLFRLKVSKQSLKALILLQNGALLTCKTLMEVYLIGMPF